MRMNKWVRPYSLNQGSSHRTLRSGTFEQSVMLHERMRANGLGARPASLGEAGTPHLVRGRLRSSGEFLLRLSFFRFLGALVQKGKERFGEKRRDI